MVDTGFLFAYGASAPVQTATDCEGKAAGKAGKKEEFHSDNNDSQAGKHRFLWNPCVQVFISIEDSEEILRAIRMAPKDKPIDLIIHTPGGLVLAATQIAKALKDHPAETRVIVPHYAMSGGTLIALAADKIIMDPHAVLGPVDPQLGQYPAPSIIRAVEQKGAEKVDDQTLILADVAKKAINQVQEFVYNLLKDKYGEEKARELAQILTEGRWTHDYPITVEHAKELGLHIETDVPEEVYALMELYKQPVKQRGTVEFMPYPVKQQGKE